MRTSASTHLSNMNDAAFGERFFWVHYQGQARPVKVPQMNRCALAGLFHAPYKTIVLYDTNGNLLPETVEGAFETRRLQHSCTLQMRCNSADTSSEQRATSSSEVFSTSGASASNANVVDRRSSGCDFGFGRKRSGTPIGGGAARSRSTWDPFL